MPPAVYYPYTIMGKEPCICNLRLTVHKMWGRVYFRFSRPGSGLLSETALAPAAGAALTAQRAYEPHRDLLTSISNSAAQASQPVSVVSAFDYTNDPLGRRVSRRDSGPAFNQPQENLFGYNPRSEVTSAAMYTNTYAYAYDPIGNRTRSSANAADTLYDSNALNQYAGIASAPGAPVTPVYDPDGNTASDGRGWHYMWDAENRLTLASNSTHIITCAYDFMGRMVSKEVSDATNNSQLETRNYLWDNWNIIAETVTDHPSQATNHTCYVWGIDLSGDLQGAGGVGGLLAAIRGDGVFAPAYDANGNVSEYVSLSDGATAAHYEYDPFGNIVVQAGDLADDFTFRFSTKPYCPITGIVHYQKRPYSPPLGRFLPRDPIGERGGRNLYGFVGNNPIVYYDFLGNETHKAITSVLVGYSQEPTARWSIGFQENTLNPIYGKYEVRFEYTKKCIDKSASNPAGKPVINVGPLSGNLLWSFDRSSFGILFIGFSSSYELKDFGSTSESSLCKNGKTGSILETKVPWEIYDTYRIGFTIGFAWLSAELPWGIETKRVLIGSGSATLTQECCCD